MELVPGRECGGCTVCCTELHINTPEMKKLAGVRCPDLAEGGCAIHASRPNFCRAFECAWKAIAALGEDWRPDRSGIILIPKTRNNPPGYRANSGVQIMILRREAIRKQELPGLVAAWVTARVPIFLTVAAPVGYHAKSAFLNGMVEGAVSRQDRRALIEILVRLVDMLLRQKPEPTHLSRMPLHTS
jgi:hypothetical protein